MNISLRAFYHPARLAVELYAYALDWSSGTERPVRLALSIDQIEDGARAETFGMLVPETAQRLMDDLWNAGIRPTEGKGSAGQLAATDAHLKAITKILDTVLPNALRTT